MQAGKDGDGEMSVLSDEQRDRLARWMGWRGRGEGHYWWTTWLNPPSWNEAGILLRQAAERGHDCGIEYGLDVWFGYICVEDAVYHGRSWENGPEAIALAILAMLEKTDAN